MPRSAESPFHGRSICVVGNVNRDIATSPLAPIEDLFRDGETPVSTVTESVGGGGANSALAAASLGARVAFMGRVGADVLGQRLERTLCQNGVVPHLTRDRGHGSGSSIALSFANGQRHFLSSLPACAALELADLPIAALDGFQHLLRADIWFSEAMLREGNRPLFEAARRRDVAVSIDLNFDPQWRTASAAEIRSRKEAVRATLPWVTLAHGNVRELSEFADAADLDTALLRLLDWGVEAVVVHLGKEGAGYRDRQGFHREPPALAGQQVRAAGTGDVLSVCMMLLHGSIDLDIPSRLRLANSIVAEFIDGRRRLIPDLAD